MKQYVKWMTGLMILAAVLFLPSLLFAQTTLPDNTGNPDSAPIDGGLSLLLAAGAAYGVKKYRDGKKKEQEGEGKLQ